jgi:hypothetical protein
VFEKKLPRKKYGSKKDEVTEQLRKLQNEENLD